MGPAYWAASLNWGGVQSDCQLQSQCLSLLQPKTVPSAVHGWGFLGFQTAQTTLTRVQQDFFGHVVGGRLLFELDNKRSWRLLMCEHASC